MKHSKSRKHNKKSAQIAVRFTEEDYETITEQARAATIPLADYARRCILARRIVAKVDVAVLAELRRLGGLLKHVHVTSQGAYSEKTRDAITALESYARNLERDITSKRA